MILHKYKVTDELGDTYEVTTMSHEQMEICFPDACVEKIESYKVFKWNKI